MHDFQKQCQIVLCAIVFLVIFFKAMYNKRSIKKNRFGFSDIQNDHRLKVEADNTHLDL